MQRIIEISVPDPAPNPDPYQNITDPDPDPDPDLIASDLQGNNKKLFFLLITF
jgi:hypothetical protein